MGIRGRRLERVAKIAASINNGDSILTHCNVSGELAMASALCKAQGKENHFFATETRPYHQGAKLTVWELKRMGANVTLVGDNVVGSLMADGLVNKVIECEFSRFYFASAHFPAPNALAGHPASFQFLVDVHAEAGAFVAFHHVC